MNQIDLGLCPYQEAYEHQLLLVNKVIENPALESLIFCSHNPVVTLGKKTQKQDVLNWKGEIVQIERGGRATYHGPGQSVVYPILNLKIYQQNLSGYLEALEKSMIQVLKKYGLNATGNPNRGEPQLTGVWVEGKKVASIGIAVKRWVTYHGLAFNLFHDPLAFQGISPCGFQTNQMTSLEELLQKKVERKEFERSLYNSLVLNFCELKQ